MKKIILFFLVLLAISACKEENVDSKDENGGFSLFPIFNNLDISDTRGTVIFSATRVHQNEFGGFDYNASAHIYTDEDRHTSVNAGSIKIGNFNLTYRAQDTLYTNGSTPNFTGTSDYFGDDVDVKILGTQYVDSASINFYSPERIEMSLSDLSELSKSTSLNITWNTDNSNPNDVYVAVVYDGNLSHRMSSTFSDESEVIYHTSTDDDGSFTIPSSAFSTLTVGSYVYVVIGRGNYKIDGNSNDKYMCISYTFDRQPLEVVN